jgi:hypothetical protein
MRSTFGGGLGVSQLLPTRFSGAGPWRVGAALAVLVALGSPQHAARAAEPTDGQGNYGKTSYLTLPFASNVYQNCWACSSYLEPGQLFFENNPKSFFNNAQMMATARYGATGLEDAGILPNGVAQRWEDTYAASFPPGTFPKAPAGVDYDSTNGNLSNDGAFVAWRDFITNHPQYWDMAFDGGTMPSDPSYYRAWGGQWGFISPLTPLDAADCPTGMKSCTWGDLYASRWAKSTALSGGYNIALSDFSDSQPLEPTNYHNFNPRVIAAFEKQSGVTVPAGTVQQQAKWIFANVPTHWNDFLSQGYATFFSALSTQIGAATGKQSVVIDQCGWSPSYRRWFGTDERIIATKLKPSNYMCIWDDQQIQSGRYGPVTFPPMQEVAGYVLAAAREPLMRNGANIEADDAAYWDAIASFYPSLSATAQKEVGAKLLKRLWVWSSWAHIADRSGNVRRALAFASRDYWDAGSLASLDPLTSLIQTIYPAQPFGPAVYYSGSVEHTREHQQGVQNGPGTFDFYYLAPSVLQTFVDAGGVAGYYVSDAALGKIGKKLTNAPSAWIVLDAQNEMTSSEMSQLKAIAPVVTTPAALAALPNQPLSFTGGLTGFGFYDQNKRLIVVVTNPSTQPTAAAITGTIKLGTLKASSYTATDLFTNATSKLTVSKNQATMPVTVGRWDTRVFALTAP